MKRLVVALLLLALILTTTACSLIDHSGANSEKTENNSTDFTTETNDIDVSEETENEVLSKKEIYTSVSSFISNIPYNSEYYSTYNITDEGTIFFFQFYIFSTQRHLLYLLKGYDGGKTWYFQDIQSAPSMNWREHIVCAKMLNERVGLISGSLFATDNNFSERTYITTNGGKDWTQVILPSTPPYLNNESTLISNYLDGEAYDLTQENGVYYLHVRVTYYDPDLYSGNKIHIRYSSTDLVNWTFAESTK